MRYHEKEIEIHNLTILATGGRKILVNYICTRYDDTGYPERGS